MYFGVMRNIGCDDFYSVTQSFHPDSLVGSTNVVRRTRTEQPGMSNGLCYFMPGRRDIRRRDNGIGINVKTISLAVLTPNVP